MKRCLIVGAAPTSLPILPQADDYVIAADGGLRTLQAHGIEPDLVLGDFDSLQYVPTDYPVVQHPVEKDDTDSALAAEVALARGCDTLIFDGCLGGLLDHSLANLALLAKLAEQNVAVLAIDGDNAITALHNGSLSFDECAAGRISIFSHSDRSTGVTLRNLYYPLENATLTRQVALGVSNEFIAKPATITVQAGTLLVYTKLKNFHAPFA